MLMKQWRIYIVKFWTRPPPGPNSFNFMQFLGKFGKIICWRPPTGELAPPPRGNPGSATVKDTFLGDCHIKKWQKSQPKSFSLHATLKFAESCGMSLLICKKLNSQKAWENVVKKWNSVTESAINEYSSAKRSFLLFQTSKNKNYAFDMCSLFMSYNSRCT